jgi:hypothetical protein
MLSPLIRSKESEYEYEYEYPHEDGDEHVREDGDEAVFAPGQSTLIEQLVVLDADARRALCAP